MAFTDPASVAVLSRLGPGWELVSANPECPDLGWDVLNCTFIKDYGSTVMDAIQVAADWPIGKRPIPGRDFWTVARSPQRLGGNVWLLQVTAHGSAGKLVKCRARSSSTTLTAENVQVGQPYFPATITIAQGHFRDSSPIIEASYILIGQEPPTDALGRAGPEYQTPPINVAIKPPLWRYLTSWAYNLPAGWNMDDLDADILSGTDTPVSLITETWSHQFSVQPLSS